MFGITRTLQRCNERRRWSWRRRHRTGLALSLLLLCINLHIGATGPNDPSCRQPCENADCGSVPDVCPYGTYDVCEGCCTLCANGPNDPCDPNVDVFGPCGDGLVCECASSFSVGRCRWIDTPEPVVPSPTPTSVTPEVPSNVTSPSDNTSSIPTETPEPPSADNMTSSVPTETPEPPPADNATSSVPTETPEPPMVTCRSACSVDYCSERETRKKRICSAMGLSPTISGRDKCLHTSCGACFLLKEPDCSAFRCPEPPIKDCLRRFYGCVRDHYFGPTATSNLIRLEDPAAATARGRVVCVVPELQQAAQGTSWWDQGSSASGSDRP